MKAARHEVTAGHGFIDRDFVVESGSFRRLIAKVDRARGQRLGRRLRMQGGGQAEQRGSVESHTTIINR